MVREIQKVLISKGVEPMVAIAAEEPVVDPQVEALQAMLAAQEAKLASMMKKQGAKEASAEESKGNQPPKAAQQSPSLPEGSGSGDGVVWSGILTIKDKERDVRLYSDRLSVFDSEGEEVSNVELTRDWDTVIVLEESGLLRVEGKGERQPSSGLCCMRPNGPVRLVLSGDGVVPLKELAVGLVHGIEKSYETIALEGAIGTEESKADPNYTKLKDLQAQLSAQVLEDDRCRKLRAELDAHRSELERDIAAAKAGKDYARVEELMRELGSIVVRTPAEAAAEAEAKAARAGKTHCRECEHKFCRETWFTATVNPGRKKTLSIYTCGEKSGDEALCCQCRNWH